MPSPCIVPKCNANHRNGPRRKVYSFPRDVNIQSRWLHAIKRENFDPTKYSKVCEAHFRESDFITRSQAVDEKTGKPIKTSLKIRRLHPDAVPTQFSMLPSYFTTNPSTRECPENKKSKREGELLCQAIKESEEAHSKYEESRKYNNLKELQDCLNFVDDIKSWTVVVKADSLLILDVITDPAPKVNCSVIVNDKLNVAAYYREMELSKVGHFTLPCQVSNINDINDILKELRSLNNKDSNKNDLVYSITAALDLLKNDENVNNDMVSFLVEQMKFLCHNKHAYRYSAEMLIFSALLYTISPQAYRFIRKSNNFVLPHDNTINSLCTSINLSPRIEQVDSNLLHYARKKFSFLSNADKLVILMLDEIHLKEYVEYKGGNITGMSFNSNLCASSAHVFMIKSVLSTYKDVVHVLPVKTLTADILHTFMKKIILGLEAIGFNVLCVITDNNAINRKAMSCFLPVPKLQFVYPHPADNNRPLFFLVDSVHLIKCVRNNWMNQKNFGQSFFYPAFNEVFDETSRHNFKTASLYAIKRLHDLEHDSLIKFGFKLSYKALFPTHLEKQNVNLVLQIFNEFVAQGLLELGEQHNLPHYNDTANFITLILTWWQIANVKFSCKGSRLNNMYQQPLTNNDSDERLIFLHKFLDWLDQWEKMKCTTGMFTKETQAALKITTYSLTQIVKYLNEELNINYILPGKFQTDDLESRFGFYRQLAGCQYHISLQQLYECEKKMRIQSVLKLKLPTKSFGEVVINDFVFDGNLDEVSTFEQKDFFPEICVSPSDISNEQDYMPVIIYLSGYCIFQALKKEKCSSCKELHLADKKLTFDTNHDFLKNLDRGQLMLPKEHIVNVVLYNYIVVKKLCFEFEEEFLKTNEQRKVVFSITSSLLEDDDMMFHEMACPNSHSFDAILKKVIWSSTNVFLNNFCKKKNEDVARAAQLKKKENKTKKESRKLQTFGVK